MKMMRIFTFLLLILSVVGNSLGQRSSRERRPEVKPRTGNAAVVIDERLALVRKAPSLLSGMVKRLKIGDKVTVFEEKSGDGVLFFRVADATAAGGWLQSEAVVGKFKNNEDQRLFRLILGSTGFTRVQRCAVFLEVFDSPMIRPSILLLYGDLIEEQAGEISKRAARNLVRREMAAARAPEHSFYLNYHELDPYRKLGIGFVVNASTRTIHYNGAAWFEITSKFPKSEQSIEARERIRSLEQKMRPVAP